MTGTISRILPSFLALAALACGAPEPEATSISAATWGWVDLRISQITRDASGYHALTCNDSPNVTFAGSASVDPDDLVCAPR